MLVNLTAVLPPETNCCNFSSGTQGHIEVGQVSHLETQSLLLIERGGESLHWTHADSLYGDEKSVTLRD